MQKGRNMGQKEKQTTVLNKNIIEYGSTNIEGGPHVISRDYQLTAP